jgi:hypothetical protein
MFTELGNADLVKNRVNGKSFAIPEILTRVFQSSAVEATI